MAAKNNTSDAKNERMVIFRITTATPLPVGQQVFISGDADMLGNWQPDGFPLTRSDDNLWTGSGPLVSGRAVEFKITRGSWDTEECDAEGSIPGDNHALPAEGPATFEHTVIRWLDRD